MWCNSQHNTLSRYRLQSITGHRDYLGLVAQRHERPLDMGEAAGSIPAEPTIPGSLLKIGSLPYKKEMGV